MTRKKQTVSMTAIRKTLSRCSFDPKKGGPLKLILDMHQDDPYYLENRAIDMIREGQIGPGDIAVKVNKLEHAITLLAIAIISNERIQNATVP